jgi:hypothetical protein
MRQKTAAEIVAARLMHGVKQRRLEARRKVREGTPREQFHAIVYLWRDKFDFRRPRG